MKRKTRAKLYIGIDPGNNGAIALLGSQETGIVMPTINSKPVVLDLPMIRDFFESVRVYKCFACIEKAQAMPKQGVVSMFNYGVGYGVLVGILSALRIPYMEVRPTAWKKEVLKGTKKDKGDAVKHCKMKYPDIDLTPGRRIKPHDGIADAVCIAEYCKKEFGG